MAETTLIGLNRYWGKFWCSRLNEEVFIIVRAKNTTTALQKFKTISIKCELEYIEFSESSPKGSMR